MDVKNNFCLAEVLLEKRLRPALNAGLFRKSVPIDQARTDPRAHVDLRPPAHQARLALYGVEGRRGLIHVHRIGVEHTAVRRRGAPVGKIHAEIDLRREDTTLRGPGSGVGSFGEIRPGIQNEHGAVGSDFSGQKSPSRTCSADDYVIIFYSGHGPFLTGTPGGAPTTAV